MRGKVGAILRKQINIRIGWPVICIAIWFVLVYLFGCLSNTCVINPVKALFCLTPIYAIEILAASIGLTYGIKCLVDRRKGVVLKSRPFSKITFTFCLFFALAFILECTVFQYNHYGTAQSGKQLSTEDEGTAWSTLRMSKIAMGSSSDLFHMNFYFSLVDIFDGSKDEQQEKIDAMNRFGMRMPSNSFDEEYKSEMEEADRIAEEYGIEAAYPLVVSYEDDLAVVRFNDVDTVVSSVYIEPFFLTEGNILTGKKTNSIDIMIIYSDEDNSLRQTDVHTIVEGAEYTNYIPLYSVGKVSSMSICFVGKGAAFSEIRLNEMIPLTPVLLRMLVVSALLMALYVLRRYQLFSVKFDPESKRQKVVFIVMLAILFGYCLTLALNVVSFPQYEEGSAGQYNHYLVDSIIDGRLDLDLQTSERFDAIERKYDRNYWMKLYGIDYMSDDVHWDTVYYQGKWYTYFGVVPALIFFVPYTMLTGQYLPYAAACLIQGYIGLVFLLLIWRRFYSKYLKNTPFLIYILTSLALAFCSFVPFLIRRSFFYETVNLGGLMFCAVGFCDNKERSSYITLTASCLCFALAVGCRPSMVLSSALVPIFLWPKIKQTWNERKTSVIKTVVAVAVPYIVVAIPLMWYNYARFGSPFDFGSTYQITGLNIDVQNLLSPMGKLYRSLTGVMANLFNAPLFTINFPYVVVKSFQDFGTAYIPQYLGAVGLLTIPVSWFLLGLWKTKSLRKNEPLIGRFILAALLVCIVTAAISAPYCVQPRYEIDYAWLVVLASLSCLYFIYEKHNVEGTVSVAWINRLVATACVVSIIMFLFLSLRGEVALEKGNDSLPFYFYIKRAFSFFEGV